MPPRRRTPLLRSSALRSQSPLPSFQLPSRALTFVQPAANDGSYLPSSISSRPPNIVSSTSAVGAEPVALRTRRPVFPPYYTTSPAPSIAASLTHPPLY